MSLTKLTSEMKCEIENPKIVKVLVETLSNIGPLSETTFTKKITKTKRGKIEKCKV